MLKMFCLLKFLIVFCVFNPQAIEANQIQIYLDDNEIKYYNEFDEAESGQVNFYMPVAPDIRYGQLYVPLKPFAKMFNAEMAVNNGYIKVVYNGDEYHLSLEKTLLDKNDKFWALSAVPYLKDRYVMAPISSVAMIFDCQLACSDKKVSIITPDIQIDGLKIDKMYSEYHMTVGGWKYEQKSNFIINNYYKYLVAGQKTEVAAPEYYHSICLDANTYGLDGKYTFLAADETILKEVYVYRITCWPPKPPAGYTVQLIYDATSGKWYLFNDEDWEKFQKILDNFSGTLIENTVF